MSEIILFDADGVLTLPEEFFSKVYARSHGLDPEDLEPFFDGEFRQATIGKADLKELIEKHRDIWKWDGTADELLKQWFEAENVRNEELLEIIAKLRQLGNLCYMATDQEKYRAQYLKDVMFKDEFDGFFISCDLGVTKTEVGFFEAVLRILRGKHKDLSPSDVLFFDDSEAKVQTAKSVGINAQLYEDIEQVKKLLG